MLGGAVGPYPALAWGTLEFAETQLELLHACWALGAGRWALGARGGGVVIADDIYPEAHAPAEAGWLERRIEDDGEMSWWWTRRGETALGLCGLVESMRQGMN
ncbi:MAG: hypothetical protein ACTHQQ_14305 [Solirubrobacteraceae bacterium]